MNALARTQLKPASATAPSFAPARTGAPALRVEDRAVRGPAPQIVREALASPGQPLDADTRSIMESRFGHDFSRVRVHTDALAAESARQVDALAYTVGSEIVVGAGQYAQSTSEGQNLLAHELTHVAQQESRAASPVLQRAPLAYETTAISLTPPPQSFTLADAKDLVEDSKTATPPDLKSGAVKGATAGSVEEIFLWFIVGQVGRRDRWGSEIDIVAPIGWPATSTDPAPVGKVTVTLSAEGDAVAELLSPGPVAAPSTFADRAAAETELKTTYGIATVADGDATWSPEDLNKVVGAFALLPAADRAALAGVTLLRVISIDGGKTAGEFSSSQSVSDEGAVTNEATLKLANKAFAGDPASFVGGKTDPSKANSPVIAHPASFRLIVHEVGHAVATKAKRDAVFGRHQAVGASILLVEPFNLAVEARNAAAAQHDTLLGEYNALVKLHNDALKAGDTATAETTKKDAEDKGKELDAKKAEYDALKKDEDAKKKALDAAKTVAGEKKRLADATRISEASLSPFRQTAASRKSKAAASLTAADAASAKFDPADAAASASYTASESYRKAVAGAAKAIEDYATAAATPGADLDDLEATAQTWFDARNTERDNLKAADEANPALTKFSPVEAAQDSWFEAERAYARAADRTKRVQRFVDFVTTNKIAPFTEYARESWPLKPEEFFSEAYSLWRADPQYLKANAKLLFDWFEKGSYRI